ncbi:MAG: hypothetical protein HKO67_02775 [Flavobacteriaceae bacterium]|nr:hypothetical protein [Flavobacteriaceae bacterium]
MKTIKKAQLIACLLGAMYASGFNMIPNQNSSLSIDVVDDASRKVKVLIKNDQGKVVMRGRIEADQSVADLFRLGNLPTGDYIIEKIYKHKIEFQTFKVEKYFDLKVDCDAAKLGSSKVVFGESYETFKPVIVNRGSLVYVSKMAFEDEELEIKVYSENNTLIYTETFKNTGRIFDFSKIEDDKLKFVVLSNGNKFVETVKF